MQPPATTEIRTRSMPFCYLCHNPGEPLYDALEDSLFGAPGHWQFKKCSNPSCGLLWIDPQPIEEDIRKAYQAYYTHDCNGTSPAYRALNLLGAALARIIGLSRERRRICYMYLRHNSPGRLLDVGSGNGQFLHRMRKLGWNVQGVELDEHAAECARKHYGVPIHIGTVESANFNDGDFDAVTMNHVIEHVHDPLALLRECRRILRPNGHLVVMTPNVNSYGHTKFRQAWRGLEPPRHLHIFSPDSLRMIAERAGFSSLALWTTAANAPVILAGTTAWRRDPAATRFLKSWIWTMAEVALLRRNPELGEEIVLQARKRGRRRERGLRSRGLV